MQLQRHESITLLLGDLVVFYAALWLTLFVRYFEVPSGELWATHAVPFTFLFLLTVIVYFIVGLYDPHTSFLRRKLPQLVTYGQTVTVVLAALFFLTVPYFGITPKTILLVFLVFSSMLIVFWRLVLTRFLGVRRREVALVIGEGNEIDELVQELRASGRYGLDVEHVFAPSDVEVSTHLQSQILDFITKEGITTIIVDTHDTHMANITPVLYNLLFLHPGLRIIDALNLYENIFRRIPISMLEHTWFIEHITRRKMSAYDLYHRTFDIAVSVALGLVTLIITPIVALLIKLEDRGPVYSFQRRVGKDNQPLALVKFRTMTVANDAGKWGQANENRVTRIGAFLRASRIDELPQLWNVLLGGYSLIGPRPEFPDAVRAYAERIPYYNARHLLTPGLSGWAQLNHHAHPHHGIDVEETRNKLSYDLYYLKNRSIWLDLEIGLKTIKTLLMAVGK
jgi:exopolysaccharide biosynthesis polyprenyl glycosylphosphotransferase